MEMKKSTVLWLLIIGSIVADLISFYHSGRFENYYRLFGILFLGLRCITAKSILNEDI